ncbi:MAG: autotransporter outer membrane beta-barrel domain-containing protein [Alphaproteobacteria bacterium]|nr:autotransporter outer membrane beta-barrel domain-containing protein [Alphaproteobacteria bacterium]
MASCTNILLGPLGGGRSATAAGLTPFVRFQASTVRQNGFTEWGADSLNLIVAPQITNSIRTVVGAQADAALDLGWRERLAVQFRLGWAHEYADVARPLTAAFSGGPGNFFTVYGAQPQRNAVALGLGLNTEVAAATSLYLRYDGEIGSGFDQHALTLGLRIKW